MAKPKSKNTPEPETAPDPLASRVGREWLATQLEKAETILRDGPDGSWQSNESLRAQTEEGVAFLQALIALLPK